MNRRYVLAGFVLTLMLVSGVFWAKKSFSTNGIPGVEESEAMAMGPADAPVRIVEYTNFQCPACARAKGVLKDFWDRYPGKIRLIFKHYPFLTGSWSLKAHQAAECAARQNRFWEYHDLVYSHQPELMRIADPTQNFFIYAQDADLDLDAFGACLLSAEVTQRVLKDRTSGQEVQVSATPTFFINEKRFVGWTALRDEGEPWIREILGLLPLPGAPAAEAVPPQILTGAHPPPGAKILPPSSSSPISPSSKKSET